MATILDPRTDRRALENKNLLTTEEPCAAHPPPTEASLQGVSALERIDGDVREGKFAPVVGSLGCGKSKPLSTISGNLGARSVDALHPGLLRGVSPAAASAWLDDL